MAKKYNARTISPAISNKNYIHSSKGGYNNCILIKGNSVLPNCVGYAWGRWREALGTTPKLSMNNAEVWYLNTKDGYKRGKTPKLGAVACWRKGVAGNGNDGAGHVAIVEKVYSDGSILTSNSAYGGSRFYTKKIAKGYKLSGYVFQGFIYPPVEFTDKVTYTYTTGTYKTLCKRAICKGAGSTYGKKKVKELTIDGRKNATSKSLNSPAYYRTGTIFTALQIKKNTFGNYWAKTPSGWLCLGNSKTAYCKKI